MWINLLHFYVDFSSTVSYLVNSNYFIDKGFSDFSDFWSLQKLVTIFLSLENLVSEILVTRKFSFWWTEF